VTLLSRFITFPAFSSFFTLALYAGFFKKAPAAHLADNTFLLNFPGETPQKALEAFAFP
jgi:hypothetical protein